MIRIDPKIWNKLITNPKIKIGKQSVRNAISKIRSENPALTMNASAHVFAQKYGFSLMKQLKQEDRAALQHMRITPSAEMSPVYTRKKLPLRPNVQPVEFESPHHKKAIQNSNGYVFSYILENTLRDTILEVYGNDTKWWMDPHIVKDDTRRYAEKIKEREANYPWVNERGNHPLYYVGLPELFGIIKHNWKDFKVRFKNLNQLEAWMTDGVPIRNQIAHHIPIGKTELGDINRITTKIVRIVKRDKTQSK